MKLTDPCWRLSRSYGIDKSTVNAVTRGDCTTEEFFTTEIEAHEADAVRCDREANKLRLEAERWDERAEMARDAIRKLKPAPKPGSEREP